MRMTALKMHRYIILIWASSIINSSLVLSNNFSIFPLQCCCHNICGDKPLRKFEDNRIGMVNVKMRRGRDLFLCCRMQIQETNLCDAFVLIYYTDFCFTGVVFIISTRPAVSNWGPQSYSKGSTSPCIRAPLHAHTSVQKERRKYFLSFCTWERLRRGTGWSEEQPEHLMEGVVMAAISLSALFPLI